MEDVLEDVSNNQNRNDNEDEKIVEKNVHDLFNKLVGRYTFDSLNNFIIFKTGDPSCIVKILHLFDKSSPALQNEIINNLICVFTSTRNLHMCRNLNVLSSLIDVLPKAKNEIVFDKALVLLEVLGKFHITVKQMKYCLAMLSNPAMDEDRKILLTQAFQNVTAKRIPQCFFDFDGVDSAIQFPAIDKWPTFSYSLSIWLCVERFEDPHNSKSYEPRLFSFLTLKGNGIEAYFVKRKLFVRTNQQNKVSLNYTFDTHRWYQLTITHSYSKMEWFSLAQSGIKFYIDGKLVFETTLKYPDVSEPLLCCLGKSGKFDNPFVQIPQETTFYGQMGMVVLFSEALTPPQAEELYNLGFDYIPKFNDKGLLTRHGAPNLLLAYHPKLCDNGVCVNLAQYQQVLFVKEKQRKMSGKLVGNCSVLSIMDFKDVLHCSTGVMGIIPLFHQKVKGSTLNAYLSLLGDVLHNHPMNQQQMLQCNGFAILGHLLRKAAAHIDSLSLSAIEKLFAAVTEGELLKELYKLMFDFDIWIGTTVGFQKQLTQLFVQHAEKNPSYFRRTFGIQFFLDIMRNYYWYHENDMPITSCSNRVLDAQQISQIRVNLLKFIQLIIGDSIELEEVQPFVYFFQDCSEPEQLQDVLYLMYHLVDCNVKGLLTHIEALGGMRPFFALLYKQNEAVRETTLKFIGKYLQCAGPKVKKQFWSEYSSSLSVAFPLTMPLYYCLIEILLEDYDLENSNDAHSKLLHASSANKNFVNPAVLGPLFKLVEASDWTMRDKVIQEFGLAITIHKNWADQFVEQPGWQGWILPLLTHIHTVRNELIYSSSTVDIKSLGSSPVSSPPVSPRTARRNAQQDSQSESPQQTSPSKPTESPAEQPQSPSSPEPDRSNQSEEPSQPTSPEAKQQEQVDENQDKSAEESEVKQDVQSESQPESTQDATNEDVQKESEPAEAVPEVPKEAENQEEQQEVKQVEPEKSEASESSVEPEKAEVQNDKPAVDQPLEDSPAAESTAQSPQKEEPQNDNQAEAKAEQDDHAESSTELVLHFLNQLLHHVFLQKDGWRSIEETESHIQAFTQRGVADRVSLTRTVYINLLDAIEDDIIRADAKSPHIWKNFVNFLCLIDNFMFYPSIHKDESGRWADFGLVQKLLDVFDFSFRPPHNDHLSGGVELSSSKGKNIFQVILRLTLITLQETYVYYYGKELAADKMGRNNNAEDESQPAPEVNPEIEAHFFKNMQRVRHVLILIIPDVIASEDAQAENSRLLIWVLFYLFKSIKRSMKSKDNSHIIIFPLVKEILRKYIGIIQKYLGSEYSFDYPQEENENTGTDEFLNYWNSKLSWNFDLLGRVELIKNEIERDETASCMPLIKQRQEKNLTTLKHKIKKDIFSDVNNKKKLDSETFSLNQKHKNHEVDRRSQTGILYTENLRSVKQQWKKLWHTLTAERSAWYSAVDGQPAKSVYWKLDPSENHLRMRKKMKRNYSGSEHKEASLTYQRQQSAEGHVAIQNAMNAPNEEELLKALSSIKITVQRSSMDGIDSFDFEDPEEPIEDSWFMVNNTEQSDMIRVSDQIRFSTSCELVAMMNKIEGRLVITNSNIHFLVSPPSAQHQQAAKTAKDKKWPLKTLVSAQKRRYLLRNNALELFFSNHRSYLFNFPKNVRKGILQLLPKVCSASIEGHAQSPAELLKKFGWTQKWQRREISNFEYLMLINSLAGRTFNDLTQYPVFPWVIKEYESKTIDLADPQVYRDLSKPIGALNPERLQRFLERYEIFDDPSIPKFLYGSHYSTLGAVLFFLVRLEPFATQFIENLQGGKFDIADRMFHSIPNAWQNCLISPSDVKELIPEFFYMPEWMYNTNNFDLGIKQDGERLDDVVLPPWASTPEEFIRINRAALESDYVSENLHDWIDLIFGFKQRGKAAEKADNLFYYLTYEGAVDIDSIEDPIERAGVESQIANFGQTPSQLFLHPHPKRDAPQPRFVLFKDPSQVKNTNIPTHTYNILHQLPFTPAYLFATNEEVIAISEKGELSIHKCMHLELKSSDSNTNEEATCTFMETKTSFPMPLEDFMKPPFSMFPNDSTILLVCTEYDNSFVVVDISSGKIVQTLNQHKDSITCFSVSHDGSILITGSKDCTLCVWHCKHLPTKSVKITTTPKHILRGHDAEITSVCFSIDLDLVVSASKDGTIITHTLLSGRYTRTINVPGMSPVDKVCLSSEGDIVAYCASENTLHLFGINGRLMKSASANDSLCDMFITKDAEFLITAGKKVYVRKMNTLDVAYSFSPGNLFKITSFLLTKNEEQIITALENGKLLALRANEKK